MRILSSTWRPVALARALEPLNNKTNRTYHIRDMDKKSKVDKWYFQERNKNVLNKTKNLLIERRVLLNREQYILKISGNGTANNNMKKNELKIQKGITSHYYQKTRNPYVLHQRTFVITVQHEDLYSNLLITNTCYRKRWTKWRSDNCHHWNRYLTVYFHQSTTPK